MKISGELDYRIRYDVEHDLFHAQNVFNDEYITPTFVEYMQKLEKENAELKKKLDVFSNESANACFAHNKKAKQLTKAKELLREIIDTPVFTQMSGELYENEGYTELVAEAEQFLKENE